MRTIWNGSLSFGLVTIPVGLAPATTPKARSSDVSFRTLHRECKTPIKQKRWCPQHDTSRAIDISRFVPLEQVDPLFFDRTYYLSPSSAAAQRRPYVLLLEAMKETGMAAIGRMVIRGNENFCLIRPKGDALVLETLFLAEDVRSQAEIDEAVEETEVQEPEALHSEYRQNLRELLEAKLTGEEISVPEPVAEAPVIDLLEALKQSVAATKPRGDGAKPAERKKAAPRKRAAARK